MKPLLYAAALLLSVLIALAMRWAFEHYTVAPRPPPVFDDPRLSFRGAAHLARESVRRYRALPPYERRALHDDVRASIVTLGAWLRDLRSAPPTLLCVGERHQDATRLFFARELLPALAPSVLMLEIGPDALAETMAERAAGARELELLGADLDAVLDAGERLRPPARVVAIDESEAQRKTRLAAARDGQDGGSREDQLVRNVLDAWRPGERSLILFGALHCRNLPGWLLHRLRDALPAMDDANSDNVVLLARYREPAAQLLFYLLEEIGIDAKVVAIPDTRRFPQQVQAWLPPVADALAAYRAAVIFDDEALNIDAWALERAAR